MPLPSVTVTVESDVSMLAVVRERVREFLQSVCDEVERNRIVLAVDEALANIIIHGYGESGCSGEIQIEMRRDEGKIVFVISDDAPPFNPLNYQSRTDISENSSKEGGLGIHTYTRLMQVRYIREGGKNYLTLAKEVATC